MLPVAALLGCESNDSPLPAVGTLERDRIALVAEANEPIVEIIGPRDLGFRWPDHDSDLPLGWSGRPVLGGKIGQIAAAHLFEKLGELAGHCGGPGSEHLRHVFQGRSKAP